MARGALVTWAKKREPGGAFSARSIAAAVFPEQLSRCPPRKCPTMALLTPAFLLNETLVSPRKSMYCLSASRLMSFTQSLLSVPSGRIREPNGLLVTSQLYPLSDTSATVARRHRPARHRITYLLFVSAPDTVLLDSYLPLRRKSVSVNELAELIRGAAKGASNRAIADTVGVAPETVNRIMRNEGDPDLETLDKIAQALKIPVVKLREAAARPTGTQSAYVPPIEANLLDDRQRRALDELIRSVVASRGAGNAVADQTESGASTQGGQAQEAALNRTKMNTRIGLRGQGVKKPRKRNP